MGSFVNTVSGREQVLEGTAVPPAQHEGRERTSFANTMATGEQVLSAFTFFAQFSVQ